MNPGSVAVKCPLNNRPEKVAFSEKAQAPTCCSGPPSTRLAEKMLTEKVSKFLSDSSLLKSHSKKYEIENLPSCLWTSRNPLCHYTHPEALLRTAVLI